MKNLLFFDSKGKLLYNITILYWLCFCTSICPWANSCTKTHTKVFRDIVQQFALRKIVNLTNQNSCSAVAANPDRASKKKKKPDKPNLPNLIYARLYLTLLGATQSSCHVCYLGLAKNFKIFPEKKNLSYLTNLTKSTLCLLSRACQKLQDFSREKKTCKT